MDDADEREAFLKAIFDAPDDDLPRLVFADWLDERGEADWAELIRVQCQEQLSPTTDEHGTSYDRGFPTSPRITVVAEMLSDPRVFRLNAIRNHPHWYGCTVLSISCGTIHSGNPIMTILTSSVTSRVARLDLAGSMITIGEDQDTWFDPFASSRTYQYEYRRVVTVQAVEALVNAREARRLTHLDLRNNDLDNDAARAIVNSKNLIRLQSLHLFEGNQLRGRTWQQLLERFGPDVVQ